MAKRILVEVKDVSQAPAENVKITVSSSDRGAFKKAYFTNKKGQSAFYVPSEIKIALFSLEKEGFQTSQETVDLAKMIKSQNDGSYLVQLILYRAHELTPGQQLRKSQADQKALTYLDKGIELFNMGDFPAAIREFEKSVELSPGLPEAHQNLASAHFRAGSYQAAVDAAQKALELNPNSSQMVKLLAVGYSKLGNENKALEFQDKLKSFADAEFSAEELFNMGVVEANKKNDAEAVRYFEKAAQANPDLALVHYQLGLCHFRMGNGEGAKKELERYLALEPGGEGSETAKTLLASMK